MENKKIIEYGLWTTGGLLILAGTINYFKGNCETGNYLMAAGGLGINSAIPYFVKRNVTVLDDKNYLDGNLENKINN